MEKQQVQINTLTDRLNYALHLGANTALLGLSVVCSKYTPETIVPLLGVVVGCFAAQYKNAKKQANDEYLSQQGAGLRSRFQSVAEEIVSRLTENKVATPIISSCYLDRPCISATTDGNGRIWLSQGCVAKASRLDQKAIIAHEVAHVKANHFNKGVMVLKTGQAAMTCFAANTLYALTTLFYGGSWIDPLLSFSVTYLSYKTTSLVYHHYARACEYQADRIAAQALSPAHVAQSYQRSIEEDVRLYGQYALVMNENTDPFMRHPPMSKRIARLRAMKPNP